MHSHEWHVQRLRSNVSSVPLELEPHLVAQGRAKPPPSGSAVRGKGHERQNFLRVLCSSVGFHPGHRRGDHGRKASVRPDCAYDKRYLGHYHQPHGGSVAVSSPRYCWSRRMPWLRLGLSPFFVVLWRLWPLPLLFAPCESISEQMHMPLGINWCVANHSTRVQTRAVYPPFRRAGV